MALFLFSSNNRVYHYLCKITFCYHYRPISESSKSSTSKKTTEELLPQLHKKDFYLDAQTWLTDDIYIYITMSVDNRFTKSLAVETTVVGFDMLNTRTSITHTVFSVKLRTIGLPLQLILEKWGQPQALQLLLSTWKYLCIYPFSFKTNHVLLK